MTRAADILQKAGIQPENAGTWSGDGGWLESPAGRAIDSINPTTGERLATVRCTDAAGYEQVMASASAAAKLWREVPAPRRGEAIRLFAEELRANKDALGALVSLENGKILAEGLGEVQEMIDIADLAVGQSRMLYGLTMHSERPQHRMYEQWHPLGVVGIISAFNFPVAVWAWNALLAAVCGNVSVWKPSPKTPLTAIAVSLSFMRNAILVSSGTSKGSRAIGLFHVAATRSVPVRQEEEVISTRAPKPSQAARMRASSVATSAIVAPFQGLRIFTGRRRRSCGGWRDAGNRRGSAGRR